MRGRGLAIGCVVLLGAAGITIIVAAPQRPEGPGRGPISTTSSPLNRFPLSFVENRGQAPNWVEYHLHGGASSVGFARRGVLLTLPGDGDGGWQLGMRFVGAQPTRPVPRVETAGTVSYFRGDPDQWTTGLRTYSRVAYEDLWPGIDLVYSGSSGRLKYSFRVAPGADPSDIRLAWRGARGLALDASGRLHVQTPAGSVVDDAPLTYQPAEHGRVLVRSSYQVTGSTGLGFRVGEYDPRRPLVIDPATFVSAGYIGGANGANAGGVAVDSSGAAYVVGHTMSDEATFPDGDGFGALPGPDGTSPGGLDAFVVKVDPSGTSLVYAGYLGGTDYDDAKGVAVDAAGAAYVVGDTESTEGAGFPVVTGPDLSHNMGGDTFVAKVAPDGSSLEYAGYIGGSGYDRGNAIAVDPTGAAYVGGSTDSSATSFPDGNGFAPIPGADQSFNGNEDVMVVKVASSGATLDYATYVGGTGYDRGRAIAVDPSGAAYVTGEASSDETTFPDGDGFGAVTGIDPTNNGGFDGILVKVAPAGTSLASAGFIGGGGGDSGSGIAVDGSGRAYLTGSTDSDQTSFPDGDGLGGLSGPDATYNGARDAFAVRTSSSGSSYEYAGFIGGAAPDLGTAIAIDGAGTAYITGETKSTEATFPDGDGFGSVTGPDITFNGTPEEKDAFVAAIGSAGSSLVSAGYIGGSQDDFGTGIAVDASGGVHLVGGTASDQSTFPDGDGIGGLPGFDTTYNGDAMSEVDAFAVKIAEPPPCRGTVPTIAGANGADVLIGTSGPDVISALGGNDTVSGLGGKDVICAGDGNDSAKGGAGNDQILGEGGNDKLTGNGGKDKIKGGSGKDNLKGSGGNDRLSGGGGKDTCSGGGGKDRAGCEKEKSTP